MPTPLISVVIPAYNQANFIEQTIQSVLDQTYSNFEILVVNDASPDDTSDVVMKCKDPRVSLLEHERNLGLPAARNTGMRASKGELIALLDADDLYHPLKLESHVDFLCAHPEVGVSYNARFELNHSAETIREIWRPPQTIGLLDLVLGFPFSPSDIVMRREWAFQVGLFDERYICGGEDTDFPCRLALAGCHFAGIDRALNYRRYHSGRRRKNLPCRLEDVSRSLNNTFKDPRCPADVLAVQGTAMTHHLMVLVSLALIQKETELGHEYLRYLVQIAPSVMDGDPCELVDFLLLESIADESLDHAALLGGIFNQIPEEFAWLSEQFHRAVLKGYLIKGWHAVMWGQTPKGGIYFGKATELGAKFDERLLRDLAYQLTSFEKEMGESATQEVLRALTPYLEGIGGRKTVQWLLGQYYADKAFQSYSQGKFNETPGKVIQAFRNNPKYIIDKGMLKILVRSIADSHSWGYP